MSDTSPEGDAVSIRGHHLFDMLGALGTGTSDHKTLGPVAIRLRATPATRIRLVVGVDDICAACEWWNHLKGLCYRSIDKHPDDNRNALDSDANAIRVLGLKPGDVLAADRLYRRIRKKVDEKVFAEQVCVACRLVNECRKTYEQKIDAAVAALGKGE